MVPTEDLTLTLELIRRAQSGDRDALERLWERYYERVRRIVRVRLRAPMRRRLDSGAILQETFLTAIRSLGPHDLRDEGAFINRLARLAEQQIRAAPDDQDGGGLAGTDPSPGGPAPSGRTARIGDIARVEAALEHLPDEYREVIILRDYAGATWDLIAEQTQRPGPDAARRLHARALLQLARLTRRDA
jgi:DNA-directed RNA polymerase specialized sigma24 family protein